MNGIDAVVLATGNDFRAIEAGVHAYAARDGQYRSLSQAEIYEKDGERWFRFWMDLPLALGTVGGLTRLHPLVKLALEVLGKPGAQELMGITAVAGLAQNFAALRSLITTGIQKGHMKMHLLNILNQWEPRQQKKKLWSTTLKTIRSAMRVLKAPSSLIETTKNERTAVLRQRETLNHWRVRSLGWCAGFGHSDQTRTILAVKAAEEEGIRWVSKTSGESSPWV